MKKFKSRTIAYRLLALLLVATTLWSCSIMASFATPDGTEENEPTCGSIAHSHTQEICYKETKTLICQMEADDTHTHGGTCYEYENKLVCEQPEGETHAHGEACYELQAAKLLCKIHVHGEDCYQVKNDLTCQLAEHIHTEECYSLCTCTPVDGVHQEGCTLYVPVEKCEHCGVELVEDAVHAEDCLTRCTCTPIGDVHQEGCALYKKPELTQKEITSGNVVVFGELPKTAELAVRSPETGDLAALPMKENEQIVFAYDISILVDGADYQPETIVEVTVPLQAELPEGTDWALSVWHITDLGATEEVSSRLNGDGTVSFLAPGFSVYVGKLTVTSSKTDGKIGDYIYFDLAAGSVTINNSTYTGYIYKDTSTVVTVTGSHSKSNKYYVYQSTSTNRATTGLVGDGFRLPEYSSLSYSGKSWGDYITNNTDVTGVIDAWNGAVGTSRTSTQNAIKIGITGTGKDCDITIDNVWSTYDGGSGANGGIMVTGAKTNGTKVTVRIKGDNRMNRIYYTTAGGETTSSLTFTSANGDNSNEGTLTVIGDTSRTVGNGNYKGNVTKNHWHAVIGASDGSDHSRGYYFNGGTIYAGSGSKWENCTAIGAGGNGVGEVTINGGRVTAVANTTGTAIGGGIAHTGTGGAGIVTINSGSVYAYNYGVQAHDVVATYGDASDAVIEAASHIPGTAIGGASSIIQAGSNGTVRINGGYVYAESLGGSALGGGNSVNKNAGYADVTITGGTVEAISKSGTITFDDNKVVTVSAGASIGGGTGGISGNGGYAKIKITNGTIKTGSIGGGGTIKPGGSIGYASAEITGGDISGQFIMAAGGEQKCTFTMSGGTLHDSNTADTKYIHLKTDGGAVYMDDPIGEAVVSGGTIQNCFAQNGGAVYMTAGTFTLSNNGIIQGCTASANGGAVYLGKKGEYSGTFTMTGGSIIGNNAVSGGAAYLDGGTMTVSGGGIQGNKASAEGGGAYLNGGSMSVSGGAIGSSGAANTAQNGGGAYLAGGTMSVSGGSIASNIAKNDGGGAYLDGGSLTITGGRIESNAAANDGGGAYISGGDFTLNGASALVDGNAAKNGAGVYLTGGTPNLLQGSMKNNEASANGGGIYIDKQLVTLKPTGDVTISGNKAEGNGAGIYIGGTTGTDASFAVDGSAGGQVHLTGNGTAATDNGGAVCISNGQFTMDADNITITGNRATNGGGVAVLSGNFSMSAGSIGANGAANLATNGGGVFVNGGTATVSGGTVQYNEATNGGGVGVSGGSFAMESGMVQNNTAGSTGGGVYVDSGTATVSGGTVQYNKAVNGGGAGVNGGDFVMKNGAVHNNTATTNGGGVYVSGGDFQMEGGEIGGASAAEANIAKNGGGVYVADGNVTIIDGAIDYNSASVNGGGMFVSSTTKTVNVIMLSGSLSNNTAAVNGGGMAVESTSGQPVTVEIGCLLDHKITSGMATLPIDYTDAYAIYAPHKHEACPVVQSNVCSGIGGGFYLNSDSSTLKFYCVIESGNQAADGKENCWGMDVEGGKVVIGDDHYHNSEASKADAHSIPYGHVQMGSPILVNGGQVDIFGDMDNPHFVRDITVNITQLGDHYVDHRCSDGTVNYKVHYVEDFLDPVTGIRSGEYIARQYSGDAAKSVTISSALFIHEGYEIKGWYTEPNGGGTPYIVGATYDLTQAGLPGMGETDTTCPTCIAAGVTKDKSLLKLYAYWAANGFDVAFHPNVPLGTNFGVKMPTQTFTYGSEVTLTKNTYVYPGHIFTGWNTMPDGSGTDYADQAVGGKITNKNGVTVTLYAQWKECTHDTNTTPEAFFIYSVDATGTVLRRDCSCGGQTLHAILSAESVTYDKLAHPAVITYPEGIEWPVTLAYLKDGTPFAESPVNAGTYTAFLTPAAAPASAMAQVTYTIAKADQQAPEKPVYVADIGASQSVLKIKPIDVSTVGTTRQYRVVYYSGGVLSDTGWQTSEVVDSEGYACRVTVNQVLTNYYVEARYDGNDNYNPSPASRADQVFYYAGDVVIYLSCQDGISGYLVKNGDGTVYINLSLDTDQYYLLNGYEFVITADSADKVPTLDKTNYLLSNIKSPSVINIAVSGAKRIPQVSSAVAEKQIFGTVINDDSTVISRDSAFTAYYVVSHYDASVYTDLGLDFNGKSLPQGATVILQNKADASYWGYTASGGEQSVLLTAFTRMGSTDKFVVSGTDLAYQFIVDFSRSAGGTANGWTVNLTADKIKDSVPVLSGEVSVTLVQQAAFSVEEIVATAQPKEPTQLLKLTYGASEGAASKWDGRDSALVLTPVANSVSVPRDIKASVTLGRNTTTYPMTANGTFVIPLSDLQAVMDVEIVLQSDLFPKEATAYEFKLEWIVSNSKADAAPLNGTTAAQINITFNKAADADPSLMIGGSDRSLPSDKTLNITVEYRNMTGYTIESEVLKKFDVVSDTGASVSQYSGIGKNIDIDRSGDMDGENAHKLSISLNGLEHGSYCVMVTVKSGILKAIEVPYYFIVQ